ncbi:protein RRP6-like 2 [Vicia villosa]|uniref:protein RRP6-like 2 n=1 Tax=Vicia villosa TaxID=3911 RepID=UPI00273BD5D8|nr:protein RRP6-like 2 [Vicia villosa]
MDFNHHLSDLSTSTQALPSDDDFRFHYNSSEFRHLIEEIARKSQSMLNQIGSSENIWGLGSSFPADIDDAYEWIVNANDDALELVDEIVDEFHRVLKEQDMEEGEDGFFKMKKGTKWLGFLGGEANGKKPKVSFHVHTLRKPQYHYNLAVDNSNQPFEHVWLEKSEDGQRFIHPLEKLSVFDFVDEDDIESLVPVMPPPLECTPFKLVEDVKGLMELADKLSSVNEFAVDLEHNQYRSFQGLTCLMQISSRTEDFIVDTLKLRDHVGTHLREFFMDPTKKKVLHGADRDIVWLQRDFGIYVCNMFDTGQASRVLKLERYSLQHLLQLYCGVTANKEYQNADWRARPLPDVMIKYGREDTHYLLYIYDVMRIKLFELSKESESSDPLLEVYERSYNVCMKLYEKEPLTEDSYLNLKGLRGAGFNGQQLAVVSGLFEWRDVLARSEDESTGFILPNKVILEIAKQMPVTTSNLRRLVAERSRLPYVERNHDIIINIVRHSMQKAAAFEEAALRLKEEHAAFEEAALRLKEENAASENGANVQLQIMPTGAYGATPPGHPVSEGNGFPDKKGKKKIKVEQIVASETSDPKKPLSATVSTSTLDANIILDLDSDSDDILQE